MRQVKQLKLVDGTDILGEITEEDDSTVTVKNPMYLSPEQGGLALIGYIPLAKQDSCKISLNHVMTMTDLVDEMVAYYDNSVILSFSNKKSILDAVREANKNIRDSLVAEQMSTHSVH